MTLTRNSWLFLCYMVVLALFSGIALASLAPVFHIPPLALGIAGMALTPYFLGFWVIFLTLVHPSWKPLALTIMPPAILGALCLLVLCKGTPLPFSPYVSVADCVGLAALGVFTCLFCWILKAFAGTYNIHHDANAYLDMARFISDSRKVAPLFNLNSIIPNFVSEPHGASYPAYLAFALNFIKKGTVAEKHATLNIAQQYLNICYLLSLFAASFYILDSLWGAACVCMLTFFPQDYRYVIFSFSRDPYRFAVALCLVLFMAAMPGNVASENALYYAAAFFILCYLTGDSHALNMVLLGAMGAAWLIALPLAGGTVASLFPLLGAVCAGCLGVLLAARKFIHAYLRTGGFMGTSWRSCVFKSLPSHAELVFKSYDAVYGEKTVKKKVLHFFQKDRAITIIGMLCAILLFLAALVSPLSYGITFSALVVIILFLPFTGLLDWKRYQFSRFFTTNIRYALYWHPFLVLSICAVATKIAGAIPTENARIFFVSLVVVLGFYAATVAFARWREKLFSNYEQFTGYLSLFDQLVQHAPDDYSIAVTNTGFPLPFLKTKVAYLFSESYWPLFHAKTSDMAYMLMTKKKLVFFVLNQKDIERFQLKRLPLYRAILLHYTKVFSDSSYEIWGMKK